MPNDNSASYESGEVERWWPGLSIEAKHRLLESLDATIDPATAGEIEAITGAPAPASLTEHERGYIRTQIEAVD